MSKKQAVTIAKQHYDLVMDLLYAYKEHMKEAAYTLEAAQEHMKDLLNEAGQELGLVENADQLGAFQDIQHIEAFYHKAEDFYRSLEMTRDNVEFYDQQVKE